MGVIITKQGIEENSFTWEYYCDSYEDMNSIAQENVTIGSYCTLLNGENGVEIYAGDGNHQWVLITPSIRDKYSAENDGKVILNGNALSQTNLTIGENGTYDTTLNNRIEVLIEPSLQNKTVTTNGVVTHDNNYYGLNQVTVNVPNSYEDEDEDKVVQDGVLVSQTSRTITANGTYDTTINNEVVVNIENTINLQSKTATVNGEILPDEGYDGLSQVTVAVEGGATLQTKTITENGTVEPDNGYDGFSEVVVNVQPTLQSKTVTENGTVTPDQGYNGLSSVVVNVPSSSDTAEWNDNFLCNWDFSNPVNTGGASFYDRTTSQETIDGWFLSDGNVTLENDGIQIARRSGYTDDGYFEQKYKANSASNFYGRTMTLTLMVDGDLSSATFVVPSAAGIITDSIITLNDVTISATIFSSWFQVTFYVRAETGSHIVNAIKLEVGSSQTLATLTSGEWVLNKSMIENEEKLKDALLLQ